MSPEKRQQIITLAGGKSYNIIARTLELTRAQVAGVVWRSKNPGVTKTGRPRTGPGPLPPERLFGRPPVNCTRTGRFAFLAPPPLLGRMKAECDRRDISLAEGIRAAMTTWLEKREG